MSSEHLYHYWKEQPEYAPTKFDIVNGASSRGSLASHIGGYYGGGEYAISDDDLNAITTESDNILVFGGGKKNYTRNKSASTVDERLMALFGNLDRGLARPMARRKESKKHAKKQRDARRDMLNDKKHTKKRIKIKRGAEELITKLKEPSPRKEGEPAMRMCDVTDEMLYYCPDLSIPQISGSSESTSESTSKSMSKSTSESTVSESSHADDIAENTGFDTEEGAALDTLFISGEGENSNSVDSDGDTDITKYLL